MDHPVSRTRTLLIAVGVAVGIAAMIGIGWMLAGDDDGSGGPDTTAAADDPSAAAGSASADPSGDPETDRAGAGGTAPPAAGEPGGEPPSGSGDAEGQPDGPRIESFEVVQEPRCPGGTTPYPDEGQPVTLAWQVVGADEVTISIDGPGVYATYPAEGSDTYTFSCAGEEGDTQEHTFLLTAEADGHTVTETLTVTATVHEQTDV